ncbi:MAG: type II secretion system secretin GspD [Pseudomonadota bacterium]
MMADKKKRMGRKVMRTHLLGAIASSALVLGLSNAAAQENCAGAVNFERADINAVIDDFAERTGNKFIVDPRVNGTMTIKSGPNSTLCADEAWELFQAGLRVSGFVATPVNGDSYRIVPIQDGARSAGPVGEGRAGDYVTQIVRLQFVDAREAAATLTQIVSERGVVSPVRTGNAIILVDVADNVERLRKVIGQIDQDTTVYRTIALNNMSASDAASIVANLAREISEENNGQRASVTVLPIEASNSILVRAEPAVLSRIANVVAELDRVGQTQADLSIITLKHANAEEMVEVLREIAGAQPQPQTNEQGVTAIATPDTTISIDPATNSVIISGDAKIQQTLRSVVSQLDVRRAQVLIEAVIVEVAEGTARELGIQYFVSGDGSENGRVPFTQTNFASAQPNILASAGAFLLNDSPVFGGDGDGDSTDDGAGELASAALSSLLALNGFAIGGAGQLDDGTVFGAILTALQQDDESRVLSLPSVMTLDNQTASLSVGQEIPITTGEAIGDNFTGGAFRTVSREQVGVILEVTPRINEGNTVTLEINQESSSVAGQIISTSTDLILNSQQLSTTALIDDGDMLVLGGLIDQSEEYLDSKVPLLGDVPVLGNLFKTQARSKDRRNLMIFIKPTIVRSKEAANAATGKKLDYIRARELLSTNEPVSELDRLIEQVTGFPEE